MTTRRIDARSDPSKGRDRHSVKIVAPELRRDAADRMGDVLFGS